MVLACSACSTLDVGEPIALLPEDSWNAEQRGILAQAARCWNMEFGTQVVVGDASVEQQVPVSFHDFICSYAAGRTEPTIPVRIYICRHRTGDDATSPAFFLTLLHELGHVLNIRGHAIGNGAVMSTGARGLEEFSHRFSPEDRQMFADANNRFVVRPLCSNVRVEFGGCACFTGQQSPAADGPGAR